LSDKAQPDDLLPPQSRIRDWRQGDFTVSDSAKFFVYLGLRDTDEGDAVHSNDGGYVVPLVTNNSEGFVITSQSCDIVRPIDKYPFVEVAPLIRVNADHLEHVRRRKRPRYVLIPGAASRNLVADLGSSMTIEKALLETCERLPGCITDEEIFQVAECFAARRLQFAFPDDFVGPVFSRCRDFVRSKAGANSADGRGLARITEIRVLASPAWNANPVQLLFYFVVETALDTQDQSVRAVVDKIVAKIQPTGRFTQIDSQIVTLADMRADEYLATARIDLDQASLL
jgi:hypothetical protein